MALDGLDEKTRDELAELALSLSGNEKTRKGFLKMIKEAKPGTPIPELDNERQLDERLAKEREESEKRITKLEDEALKRSALDKKRDAMQTLGLGEDDWKKMEEMMQKGELPADYNWAPQLYKSQVDASQPTTYGSAGGYTAELPSHEGIMDNPQKWATSQAHDIIDEMRKKGHSFTS